MDENGLLSEIFGTRYFGTTKCIVLYNISEIVFAITVHFLPGFAKRKSSCLTISFIGANKPKFGGQLNSLRPKKDPSQPPR